MGGILGACHGLEVPLVFGNLTSGQPAMLLADDLTDAELLSTQISNAWTTFATNGNRGSPEYDPPGRVTRVFDTEPTVVPYPEEMSRRIWQDHIFITLPLKPHREKAPPAQGALFCAHRGRGAHLTWR